MMDGWMDGGQHDITDDSGKHTYYFHLTKTIVFTEPRIVTGIQGYFKKSVVLI